MPVSKEKADLKNRFHDNPEAIARHLTESLAKNELGPFLKALNQILIGQNVMAVACESGMRRENIYRSLRGKVDPPVGRVLALLDAIECRVSCSPAAAETRPSATEAGPTQKDEIAEAHK
jgi:probable addiction module antidote protein